jgi:hypothetical protein
MNEYVITVDIAKKRDYTSIFIAKQTPDIVEGNPTLQNPDRIIKFMDIVYMEQFNNISYPNLVKIIGDRAGHSSLVGNSDLLVDGTGIGEAVVDLLREKGLSPIPIIFTGGNASREVYHEIGSVFSTTGQLRGARMLKEIHVPKTHLIDAGRIMMQQRRVRVAPGLKEADDFRNQLASFTTKANGKTEADSELTHDDKVVCFLMGAWWIVRHTGATDIQEKRIIHQQDDENWNPSDYY